MSDAAWGQSGHSLAYKELDQDDAWPAAATAWYWLAVVITLANLVLFFALHRILRDSIGAATGALQVYYKRMRGLGIVVLVVYVYRTFFLVSKMDRFVWHDTPLSSILLIQLLSYVKQLAYVGMIVLATREIGSETTQGKGCGWLYTDYSTKFLGLAVVVSQIFSFVGLVKKSDYYMIGRSWSCLLGWGCILPVMCYLLCSTCKASTSRGGGCLGELFLGRSAHGGFECHGTGILFLLFMIVGLVCYLLWLCFVDLPTYYSRFGETYAEQVPDLGFVAGLWDALTFRVQTSDWDVWKQVVWWNTICTTFGSWFTIFLSTGPGL